MPRLLDKGPSMKWLLKKRIDAHLTYWEPKLYVPQVLKDKGVTIIDPVNVYMKQPLKNNKVIWTPPVADDPRYMTPQATDHNDWQENAMHIFDRSTHLHGGITQGLVLTKSQMCTGLPSAITDRIGAIHIPRQKDIIQQYIMQAHKYNPTMSKLPRRFNTMFPGYNYKAEFGIPRRKTMNMLTSSLLRLCCTQHSVYPDLLTSRHVMPRWTRQWAQYQYQDRRIHLTSDLPAVVGSQQPLPAAADADMVHATTVHTLPALFPVSPFINLEKGHIYRPGTSTDVLSNGLHPHTIFYHHNDHWTSAQRNGRSLVVCFTHALAHVHKLYGPSAGVLPAPITVQCINTANGIDYDFTVFQLNTVDMDNEDGVKNIVWFDNDNKMFNKVVPKRAMLRNTVYEDYNSNVIDKILALYMNGVCLNSS